MYFLFRVSRFARKSIIYHLNSTSTMAQDPGNIVDTNEPKSAETGGIDLINLRWDELPFKNKLKQTNCKKFPNI